MQISLKNINKGFKNKLILNNLNLTIKQGDSIAIIGNSGSGKSTLLKTIGLLTPPDSGNIYFNDINYTKVRQKQKMLLYRKEIGFIFQDYGLIEDYSLYNNLSNSLFHQNLSHKEETTKINNILKEFNLEHHVHDQVNTLSGGEKQRVSLMKIILKNPSIILADEPTGSLDEENSTFVTNYLLKLNNQGKTLIIVTHNLNLANKMKQIIHI